MDHVQAAALLRSVNRVLILTHKRPDGDTIGSAAGLCLGLRGLGKQAWVLPNPDITGLFSPYLDGLLAGPEVEPEFVVSVDIASLGLFPQNAAQWLDKVDLAIDHHPSHEGFGAHTCLDAGRAACGELVYDIVCQLGTVTAELAQALYVAVSTDTGCFVYGNTTPDTHRVAAALMEAGIDYAALNKRHFRTKSWKRLNIERRIVEQMQLYDGGKIAIAAVTQAMLKQEGATEEDLEDIAAFVGQTEGVETSVTLRELADGSCKLSVRTSGGLNANHVCAQLGGGGHAAAAGCTVPGPVASAREQVLAAIRTVRRDG